MNKCGSSLYKKNDYTEMVEVIRASDYIERYNIRFIDLTKINIEGAEYDLMLHLINTKLISKIKNIQIQFHDFVPDAEEKMNNIHDVLKLTHELTYYYRFIWENWELKQ